MKSGIFRTKIQRNLWHAHIRHEPTGTAPSTPDGRSNLTLPINKRPASQAFLYKTQSSVIWRIIFCRSACLHSTSDLQQPATCSYNPSTGSLIHQGDTLSVLKKEKKPTKTYFFLPVPVIMHQGLELMHCTTQKKKKNLNSTDHVLT